MKPCASCRAAAEPAGARSRRAGFSLVEVLVALVLTGVLVALLVPFAGTILARWAGGQRNVEDADLWMRATVRLAADVAEAIPLPRDGADGRPALHFVGEERRIVFVRTPLSEAASAPLEIVTYALERTGEGEALVRGSSPLAASIEAGAPAPTGRATIVSGPYRFRFGFIDDKGELRRAWDVVDSLPRAIRIEVETTAARLAPPAPILLAIPARRLRAPIEGASAPSPDARAAPLPPQR